MAGSSVAALVGSVLRVHSEALGDAATERFRCLFFVEL